jgi:lipopolysaccharide/colanic/teichoic acid biosynthesis glycosyltransferase
VKRFLDIVVSFIALFFLFPLILFLVFIQTLDTKKFGLFRQLRVGKKGKLFYIYKIRTMINNNTIKTNITTIKDSRITKIGAFLRKYKLDELPQFFNVFIGNMSVVGPRPDVKEFIDSLDINDREIILSIKPGITGPGSLELINEEEILANVQDPIRYNTDIIWPKKLELLKNYIRDYSILYDISIIFKTIFFIIKKK